MSLPSTPFTEQANPLTRQIDSVAAQDIVRILGDVDEEVFCGVNDGAAASSSSPSASTTSQETKVEDRMDGWEYAKAHSLTSADCLEGAGHLADLIAHAVRTNLQHHHRSPNTSNATSGGSVAAPQQVSRLPYGVVFAGCGTSGRVAFLCARGLNAVMVGMAASAPSMTMFRYIMAAGDEALVLSIELPEDDPFEGQRALEALEPQFDKIIVVGITCGLSAPFVAGMLHHAMTTRPDKYHAVLLGFNPPELSRQNVIDKWRGQESPMPQTCRDVFGALSQKYRMWLSQRGGSSSTASAAPAALAPVIALTPIVGPEAITGSSRMKGGSATLALLNAVAVAALSKLNFDSSLRHCASPPASSSSSPSSEVVARSLRALRSAVLPAIYSADSSKQTAALGEISKLAAATVQRGGRIVYCGVCATGSAGAIGIMDASEMVDTYGCDDDEWRALVLGGWGVLRNQEGQEVGLRARPSASRKLDQKTKNSLPSLLAVEAVRGPARSSTGDFASQQQQVKGGVEAWLRKGDCLILLDLISGSVGSRCAHCRCARGGGAAANSGPRIVTDEEVDAFLRDVVVPCKGEVGFSVAAITVASSDNHSPASVGSRFLRYRGLCDAEAVIHVNASNGCNNNNSKNSENLRPAEFLLDNDTSIVVCRCHRNAAASPPDGGAVAGKSTCDCSGRAPGACSCAQYNCAAEFALKLATNAVSTAAQIQRGAVFSNRMINVTVSNNKLYFRTLGMVQMFASMAVMKTSDAAATAASRQVTSEVAEQALLASIYRDHTEAERSRPEWIASRSIEDHVTAATPMTNVLPIATLIAAGVASTPQEAERVLASYGTLRNAIAALVIGRATGAAATASVATTSAVAGKHDESGIYADKGGYIIRRARYPADIPGAYHVCMKTGNFGADGEPFYKDDPDALGRVYVGPYMKFEPDFAVILERKSTTTTTNNNNNVPPVAHQVAVSDDGVSHKDNVFGYSFGALDTKSFFERYEREWRPQLAKDFPEPTGDSSSWTRAQQMYHVYHHPSYDVPVDLTKYPAHLHIDLLEPARGAGIGRTMLETVMARLKEKGAVGVHLCMSASNARAYGFYRKLGFEELARKDDDLFMGKVL